MFEASSFFINNTFEVPLPGGVLAMCPRPTTPAYLALYILKPENSGWGLSDHVQCWLCQYNTLNFLLCPTQPFLLFWESCQQLRLETPWGQTKNLQHTCSATKACHPRHPSLATWEASVSYRANLFCQYFEIATYVLDMEIHKWINQSLPCGVGTRLRFWVPAGETDPVSF